MRRPHHPLAYMRGQVLRPLQPSGTLRGLQQPQGTAGQKDNTTMEKEEQWITIAGYSNYAVSNRKRVKNLTTGKIVGHRNNSTLDSKDVAYLKADDGHYKMFTIERLFGKCFGYQPPTLPGEIWKESEAPGIWVSNLGRLFSTWNLCIMVPQRKKGKDYIYVRDRYKRQWPIHRLVAFAFVPGRDMFRDCVDHINEDKKDNRACNLRWCTVEENNQYWMNNHTGAS